MQRLAFTHCVTVSFFQLEKDNRREECHSAKNVERFVNAADEFKWIRLKARGKKEDRQQRCSRDAECDRQLLHRTRDRACAARRIIRSEERRVGKECRSRW